METHHYGSTLLVRAMPHISRVCLGTCVTGRNNYERENAS